MALSVAAVEDDAMGCWSVFMVAKTIGYRGNAHTRWYQGGRLEIEDFGEVLHNTCLETPPFQGTRL
jgi:hypothetical protein